MRDNRWSSDAWDLPAARDPLYVYLAKRLEELIESGHWKKGEMLPSEIKLAELFKVSPGTARSALKILTEKGVLLRRQGKGTFGFGTPRERRVQLYLSDVRNFVQFYTSSTVQVLTSRNSAAHDGPYILPRGEVLRPVR